MASSASTLTRVLAPLAVALVVFGAAAAMAQQETAAGKESDRPERDSPQSEPPADRPLAIPSDDPPTLRIPENLGPDLPPTADDQAPAKIRDALRQHGDGDQTGDPILDGVLDAIRSRGSVLDDSLLDPRHSDGEPLPRPELRPLPRDGFGNGAEGRLRHRRELDSRSHELIDAEANFLLAEQLLKTARLLAARSDSDVARRRLIDSLRGEAARVLAETRLPPPEAGPAPAGHAEPSRAY